MAFLLFPSSSFLPFSEARPQVQRRGVKEQVFATGKSLIVGFDPVKVGR